MTELDKCGAKIFVIITANLAVIASLFLYNEGNEV
jgi:hypothetical protein